MTVAKAVPGKGSAEAGGQGCDADGNEVVVACLGQAPGSEPAEEVTIVDAVSYQGLTPGFEYRLVALLMDKQSGEPFAVGDEIIGSPVDLSISTACSS